MSRKITKSLTTKGISELISEINKYSRNFDKSEVFIKRLSEIGIETIHLVISSEGSGDTPRVYDLVFTTKTDGKKHKGRIAISGTSVLFWEFGAGITFNKDKKHPLADKLGYGVGTYPEQTHAFDPEGWWYLDERDNEYHHTFGTEATMPMFQATQEMQKEIMRIAKEVFLDVST